MNIDRLLEDFPFIVSIKIIDWRDFVFGYYIKLYIEFVDNTELYVREYNGEFERYYSFHWQNTDGELIVRWDNAPHHKEIETFPHHKHIGDKIVGSSEITLYEILNSINEEVDKL